VQSEAPGVETTIESNSSRFWIDASIEMAFATLFSYDIYNARIVNHAGSNDQSIQGLIQVEEIRSPITSPVAMYVAHMETYSEKDCRAICKEIAVCVQIMHDAGIAHRNLHLANVEIDPFVSSRSSCLLFIYMQEAYILC
jgi:serine/threonine protein kinase